MKNRISIYIKVEGTPSDAEDEAVPGAYLVSVDAELDEGDRCSAALDIFHEHIGIECLDDFEITVLDETGNELAENENAKSYTLGDRGEFLGSIAEILEPSTTLCG